MTDTVTGLPHNPYRRTLVEPKPLEERREAMDILAEIGELRVEAMGLLEEYQRVSREIREREAVVWGASWGKRNAYTPEEAALLPGSPTSVDAIVEAVERIADTLEAAGKGAMLRCIWAFFERRSSAYRERQRGNHRLVLEHEERAKGLLRRFWEMEGWDKERQL